jgi:hypothetical protein
MLLAERRRLAERQAALVRALVGQGPAPADVDGARVAVCAASLAVKRRVAAARLWPEVSRSLGGRFAERFAAYAAECPLPLDGGPLLDGRAFARWLADREPLTDAARLEVLAVDVRWVATASGLRPRRGPWLRIVRLEGRWAVAWRLPWLGGSVAAIG